MAQQSFGAWAVLILWIIVNVLEIVRLGGASWFVWLRVGAFIMVTMIGGAIVLRAE